LFKKINMPLSTLPGIGKIAGEPNANDERIIVIGASAGGLEALKAIVKSLPANFSASIFIVWHMSPDVRGILPQVFNRLNSIYAADAYDKEIIKPNRIYVAPPDHHLLIEKGRVRITRGPKENRFRPAIDPLFRSAAYYYSNHVIGIILSGALDDGTAGLLTIKQHGGIAIVQDPDDAEVPSMPLNAARQVAIDYSVAVEEIPGLLVRLLKEKPPKKKQAIKDEKTKTEIEIAAEEGGLEKGVINLGAPSPFACPECHGVLLAIKDGTLTRYRCHTGHAYSVDTLLAFISEKVEDSLYNAIRGLDETIMLLNHIGDHYAEVNHSRLAAFYFQKAKAAEARAAIIRRAALSSEELSKESLLQQATEQENIKEAES
jgi:two-component system chemotaxis response regulator CheB